MAQAQDIMPVRPSQAQPETGLAYLRMPGVLLFNLSCRILRLLRFGFEMMNVPLPMYSAW
jgi:hypothetical protein